MHNHSSLGNVLIVWLILQQAVKEKRLAWTDIELLNLPLPELSEQSTIMNNGHLHQVGLNFLTFE
jgi:hypothetical protein